MFGSLMGYRVSGRGAAARRQQNRREMREAIVGAAERIVAEQGIEALTMRAVGQAIGYSAAALYEYFPAKEDLYAALYFDGRDGLAQRMRETLAALPPGTRARERLLALGHAYRAFAHRHPQLFRLAFGRAMAAAAAVADDADDPECEAPFEGKDAFGVLVDVAAAGIEAGELVPLSPPVLAVAAWTAIHGFVILEINGHIGFHGPPSLQAEAAGPGFPSPDELFGAVARLFADNVSRHPAAPVADP
jgi:AcrR family transcriptional regulator